MVKLPTMYQFSAMEALDAFKLAKDSYDLVITDKTMPQMTGFDLTREIKKLRPDIPVILCTGFGEKEDTEKSKAVGINGFVVKPLNRQKLAETIRKVLDKTES